MRLLGFTLGERNTQDLDRNATVPPRIVAWVEPSTPDVWEQANPHDAPMHRESRSDAA